MNEMANTMDFVNTGVNNFGGGDKCNLHFRFM